MSKLDTELSKYRLDDLLYLIGRKSQEMYMNSIFFDEVIFRKLLIGTYYEIKRLNIPIWALTDISYKAIINSNDHITCIPDYKSLLKIVNMLAIEENDKSKVIPHNDIEAARPYILFGLPITQFPYQDLLRGKVLFYRVIRYYVILNVIPVEFPKLKCPSADLVEITGFNYEEFFKILMLGYSWVAVLSPEISFNLDESITNKNVLFNSINLRKCLGYFVGDYDYYRDVKSVNSVFYKPIVMTKTGRYIISNAFLWAIKLYEGMYWIIRQKYEKDEKGNEFTANFGQYFEKYCEWLLSYYLKVGKFEKIVEKGKADWILYSKNYIVIIEQKSSLMSVQLKKEYPSVDKLKNSGFMDSLKKAYEQLCNTENGIKSSKKVIKVILHFEKLYIKEAYFKKLLTETVKSEVKQTFLWDIEEFEQIIQILGNNEEQCEEILNLLLQYEINPPPISAGRDMKDIIETRNLWKEIMFLEQYGYIMDIMHEKGEN